MTAMDIENVFTSKFRIKTLEVLARVGELNVSEIARRLGVNYVTINAHLKVLEDEGLIVHKQFGRMRLYRFNPNSRKAEAVLNLLEVWEKQDK